MWPIILITTLHYIEDRKRRNEVLQVLVQNIRNCFFQRIIIFFENFKFEYLNEEYVALRDDKVTIVTTENRQTYKMLFEEGNKAQYKDYFIVIGNTDILYNETIRRVDSIKFTNKILSALTRWNRVKKGENNLPDEYGLELQPGKNVSWSFDTYIFKSPLACNLDDIDLEVGVPGCDTLLLKRLCYENLIEVNNPCLDIRTFHIDDVNRVRTGSNNDTKSYWYEKDYPKFDNPELKNKSCTRDILRGIRPHFIECDAVSMYDFKIYYKVDIDF